MIFRYVAPPKARLSRRKTCVAAISASNDNPSESASDAMLDAALRHFAEHGLAAAQRARKQAETAFFAGDRPAYQWWLEICRALDRRMASELGSVLDRAATSDRA